MKPGIPFNPESLLSNRPSLPASSLTADSADMIELLWSDVGGLVSLVKNYARAGTAAKAICGLRLRILREFYFGPRNPEGGRPKNRQCFGEFKSWNDMLVGRIGIDDATAKRWMQMADAVEKLAELEGISLRETCEKLPWNWTPEEAELVETTVQRLTEDKTQRQLLQADFLPSLGYVEPERANGSNNPLGKNGGKKKPAASVQDFIRERQEAARLILFGTVKPGRSEFGSPARFICNMVNSKGAELQDMPKRELQDFYENDLKPFADLIRDMVKNPTRRV